MPRAALHGDMSAFQCLSLSFHKQQCYYGRHLTGRLDSFFTIKPAEPGTKRKEPPTKGKAGAKAAKTGKKGGVGAGKKK
jgi:hypothetical protein